MQLYDIVISMRPKQWTKNLFLFAGVIFAKQLLDINSLVKSIAGFVLFCLISGSVYIINDLYDIEKDRIHPKKRNRPIASGRIGQKTAGFWGVILFVIAIVLSLLLNLRFAVVGMVYFLTILAYSFRLKHIVILDVLIIALGFVLRAVAGAFVIDVAISPWLLICTILLALFLALGKRRGELISFSENASNHREILNEYSPYLLDQMISVVTSSTVVAYALYTMSEGTVEKFGSRNLEFTIPFVLYGIFRYLYLLHKRNLGDSPENVLLSDKPLLVSIGLWGISVFCIIYLI